MKRLLTCLALVTLALGSVASAQSAGYVLHQNPHEEGASYRWLIHLRITEIGLIANWSGYFQPREQEGGFSRTLVATDPGGVPDTVLSGTSKVGSWTVKVNYSSEGQVTRIWGQDATGQYWVGSLVFEKFIDNVPPKNRRALRKTIR
jgi:hypothetical protein